MYVYVVAWKSVGPVKVGRSSDLDARLAGLRTGCPYKLRYYDTVWAGSFGYEIERKVHELLAARRLRREWFLCSTLEAVDVLRDVEDNYLFKIIGEDADDPDFGKDVIGCPLVPLGPAFVARPKA